ncbi:MAG: hypothetical protein AB7P03_11595 [Kofleriaceae bacterium]
MLLGRPTILAALILAGALSRTAHADAPDCGPRDPATTGDALDGKQLEETARAMLGPAIAPLVKRLPWNHLRPAAVSPTGRSSFVIDRTHVMPVVSFAVAAPSSLKIDVELKPKLDIARCIGVSVAVDSPEDGKLTIQAPMSIMVTMSLGGFSERWELSSDEISLDWHGSAARVVLDDAGRIAFGLPGEGSDQAALATMATLRDSKLLARWRELLIRTLAVPGGHRESAVTMLADLGFQHVPGDIWVQLRRLDDAGKLRASEVERLGLLARRPELASDSTASTFIASAAEPPPRLFVAGKLLTGWTVVDDRYELRVPLWGLVPVRAELPGDVAWPFATVLGPGVRIRLSPDRGPVLESRIDGARCGLVEEAPSGTCSNVRGRPPVGRPFELLEGCGEMPSSFGTVTDFGAFVVPSLPGLYILDREQHLYFDPSYGGRASALERCD